MKGDEFTLSWLSLDNHDENFWLTWQLTSASYETFVIWWLLNFSDLIYLSNKYWCQLFAKSRLFIMDQDNLAVIHTLSILFLSPVPFRFLEAWEHPQWVHHQEAPSAPHHAHQWHPDSRVHRQEQYRFQPLQESHVQCWAVQNKLIYPIPFRIQLQW